MLNYILRRLLLMFPTLLGITVVVFVVMAAAPGGISPQTLVEGQGLEPEARKALEDYYNKLYGLDSPPPIQYLRWLNNVSPIGFTFDENNEVDGFSFAKGSNLGRSFKYGRPVTELLVERVPITLLLNLVSLPIIYLIAIGVGVRAATQRGQAFDVGSSGIMLALWSVPTMLAGVLMMGFFASDQYWHWFPTAGLNSREALDMPFLPHWDSTASVVGILLLSALLAFAQVWLSQNASRNWRTMVMAIVGFGLGSLMVNALPGDSSVITYLLMSVAFAVLFGGMGFVDFPAMRAVSMGSVGLLLGIALGGYLSQVDFVRGFILDRMWHLVLPVACFTYGGFAFLSKLTRTAVLENLLADYARTARAKGVLEKDVLWRHVFRNSLLPLITVSASLLPGLLGGSVIIESIFSIDGMGKLAVEAVQSRDRELVLSVTLVSGVLTLLSYLIADVCYAIADPRVSYD